jgi:hypothetical protein
MWTIWWWWTSIVSTATTTATTTTVATTTTTTTTTTAWRSITRSIARFGNLNRNTNTIKVTTVELTRCIFSVASTFKFL